MTTRRPASLSRTGRQINAKMTEGSVFSAAIAASTALLLVALFVVASVIATYEARADRDGARVPVGAQEGQVGTVMWAWSTQTIDEQYVDVVYLIPLVDEAPLPPGLDSWPAPGTVVLSPAISDLDDDGTFGARFGEVAPNLISREGLADAGEHLAYVRPALDAPVDAAGFQTIIGFGVEHGRDSGVLGSSLRTKTLSTFLMLVFPFVIVPALVLLVLSARVGANRRDSRLGTLDALGASRAQRAVVLLGMGGRPILAGVALAMVVLAVAFTVDLTMPFTEYVVYAHDLRRGWDLFAVAALTGVLVVLVTLVWSNRLRRRSNSSTAPQARAAPPRARTLLALPAACAILVYAFDQAHTSLGPTVATLVYLVGLLAVLAAIPSFCGTLVAVIGRLLVRVGWHRGLPGVLTAGRQLLADPRAISRLTAALAIALVLVAQIQIWTSKAQGPMLDAIKLQNQVGDSAMTVGYPTDADLENDLRVALQPLAHQISFVVPDLEGSTVNVVGTCEALTSLNLSCTDPTPVSATGGDRRVSASTGLIGAATVVPVLGSDLQSPDGEWIGYLLIPRSGDTLPVEKIRAVVAQSSIPPSSAETLGESWIVSANEMIEKGRWVGLFGACAIIITSIALAASSFAEFVRLGNSVTAWAVVAGSRRVFAVISGWRIFVPLLTATLAAVAVSVVITAPLTTPQQGGRLPVTTLVVALTAGSALALLLTALATAWTARVVRRWRPGT